MFTIKDILALVVLILFLIVIYTPFICLLYFDHEYEKDKLKRKVTLSMNNGCIRWDKTDNNIEYINECIYHDKIIVFRDYNNKRGRD